MPQSLAILARTSHSSPLLPTQFVAFLAVVAVVAATKVDTYGEHKYDTPEVDYAQHYQPQQSLHTVVAEEPQHHYHHQQEEEKHQYKHIPILKSESHTDKDGSYKYAFEAANGIHQQEHGYVKNAGSKEHEIQVAEGFYSYTDEHGHQVGVHYIADENGFRATGDHLPTPPPLPEALREAYAKAVSDPDYKHEEESAAEVEYKHEEQPQQSYEHLAYHQAAAAANHHHHPVQAAPAHHSEYAQEEYKH